MQGVNGAKCTRSHWSRVRAAVHKVTLEQGTGLSAQGRTRARSSQGGNWGTLEAHRSWEESGIHKDD